MSDARRSFAARAAMAGAGLAILLLAANGAWSGALRAEEASAPTSRGGYVVPFGDAERGRRLFVAKACVVCHSIDGIGGTAGPALDADPARPGLDIFDFAARMWRGAPLMALLQEMELGYQVEFTGAELADIARFLHDPEAQKDFDKIDIPQTILDWMAHGVYEELERRKQGP